MPNLENKIILATDFGYEAWNLQLYMENEIKILFFGKMIVAILMVLKLCKNNRKIGNATVYWNALLFYRIKIGYGHNIPNVLLDYS